MIQAYPIHWPAGWPRTPPAKRWPGRFQVSFAMARDGLLDELRRLGAKGVVISSDVPTRRDGLPLARGWRQGDDPGVAIYFELEGSPRALACDTYASPEANLRALGLSVEALRALGRHGVTGMMERAFEGFKALPNPDAMDWRATLGFAAGERPSAADVLAHWRELARAAHPDHGGSGPAMVRINEAKELAMKEVGSR